MCVMFFVCEHRCVSLELGHYQSACWSHLFMLLRISTQESQGRENESWDSKDDKRTTNRVITTAAIYNKCVCVWAPSAFPISITHEGSYLWKFINIALQIRPLSRSFILYHCSVTTSEGTVCALCKPNPAGLSLRVIMYFTGRLWKCNPVQIDLVCFSCTTLVELNYCFLFTNLTVLWNLILLGLFAVLVADFLLFLVYFGHVK